MSPLTRLVPTKQALTWSPVTESNRRPSPYHGDALPTELTGPSNLEFRALTLSSGSAQRWYDIGTSNVASPCANRRSEHSALLPCSRRTSDVSASLASRKRLGALPVVSSA